MAKKESTKEYPVDTIEFKKDDVVLLEVLLFTFGRYVVFGIIKQDMSLTAGWNNNNNSTMKAFGKSGFCCVSSDHPAISGDTVYLRGSSRSYDFELQTYNHSNEKSADSMMKSMIEAISEFVKTYGDTGVSTPSTSS